MPIKYNLSKFPLSCKAKERMLMKMSSQVLQDSRLPINQKVLLTIKEAAEYSNIGINKIDAMLKQPNCPFVLYVGTRKLVKRKEFELYLSGKVAI